MEINVRIFECSVSIFEYSQCGELDILSYISLLLYNKFGLIDSLKYDDQENRLKISSMTREMYKVIIHTSDKRTLTDLIREHPLDIGCTGGIRRQDDGGFIVQGYLPATDIDTLPKTGIEVKVFKNATSTGLKRLKEVPKGNRFSDSSKVPRGFGRKE